MLILSVYLISKSPNLGIKISLAYSKNDQQPVTGLNYVEEINISASKIASEIGTSIEIENLHCVQEEADKINSFFKKQRSPLENQGCTFSSQAHENSLNPYLLPAIAMCESTGGKNIAYPFNAWGWGITSSREKNIESGAALCDSWKHCIGRVSRGIAKKADRGTTPTEIVEWYNGGDKESWVNCVTKYSNEIESTTP